MKVLVVARYKEFGYAPFVKEQVEALERQGIEFKFYPVRSKGVKGYLREVKEFRRTIKTFKPDLIHAHYGLCGLFANLQRRVPVVTTYHGSDINIPSSLKLSQIAIRLSAFNIFVSQRIIDIAKPKENFMLIPCGIHMEDYPVVEKSEARRQMGLKPEGKYVLFAGAFDNTIKNAQLAKDAVALLPDVELLELKGYTRHQVALLMQAVDAFLMTSLSEGSPQVIKEAMACGCPIVSNDVGDVKDAVAEVQGCYLADRNPSDLAGKLKQAIVFGKTTGRERVLDCYDSESVAKAIVKVYLKVLDRKGINK